MQHPQAGHQVQLNAPQQNAPQSIAAQLHAAQQNALVQQQSARLYQLQNQVLTDKLANAGKRKHVAPDRKVAASALAAQFRAFVEALPAGWRDAPAAAYPPMPMSRFSPPARAA